MASLSSGSVTKKNVTQNVSIEMQDVNKAKIERVLAEAAKVAEAAQTMASKAPVGNQATRHVIHLPRNLL